MKKKVFATILAGTLLTGAAIGAGAAPVTEKITAALNWGVKLESAGLEWTPKDAAGNKTPPITYNGSTYLPVRAVSDLLGVAVDWKKDSNTIYVGEKQDSVDLISFTLENDYSVQKTKDKQFTVQAGKDYKSGLLFSGINSASREAILLTKGAYQTAELTFAGIENERELTVQIMDENEIVFKEIKIAAASAPQNVTVDIQAAKKLMISVSGGVGESDQLFVGGSLK
ncbi:stalk domain-containing protein [Saccharibacillus sacchari]|uniref:Stalk domain-containing protein n=1 Tax=Saccharibacillus sacchari TaxID=456493 RepID=A0ACC6PBF4_9BACL